jgi:hypothetical protein
LNSKLTYSLSGRDRLALSFYNGSDNLDQAQDLGNLSFRRGGPPDAGQTPVPVGSENLTKWGNIGASGNWSRVWSDRFYSSLLAAYSNYFSKSNRGLSAGSEKQNATFSAFSSAEDNEVQDLSLRLDNEWQLHKSHRFEFGAWLSRTNVGVQFMANDTISILQQDNEAEQAAFYLQDQWQIFRAMELTLGMRATYYQPTQTTYYEPRVRCDSICAAGLRSKARGVNIINSSTASRMRMCWKAIATFGCWPMNGSSRVLPSTKFSARLMKIAIISSMWKRITKTSTASPNFHSVFAARRKTRQKTSFFLAPAWPKALNFWRRKKAAK